MFLTYFFFQAEDGIRDYKVTGVQTCALPISKQLERGTNEAPRVRLPQWVIEVDERLEHPRLAPPILHLPESFERVLARGRICRERRHDERESGLSIRILRPLVLCLEHPLPSRHLAHGELQREGNFIRLGQRQSWDLLLATPHALEPGQAVGRHHRIAIGVEPRRLLTLRLCAI